MSETAPGICVVGTYVVNPAQANSSTQTAAAMDARKRNEKARIVSTVPFRFCRAARASGRKSGNGSRQSALEAGGCIIRTLQIVQRMAILRRAFAGEMRNV